MSYGSGYCPIHTDYPQSCLQYTVSSKNNGTTLILSLPDRQGRFSWTKTVPIAGRDLEHALVSFTRDSFATQTLCNLRTHMDGVGSYTRAALEDAIKDVTEGRGV